MEKPMLRTAAISFGASCLVALMWISPFLHHRDQDDKFKAIEAMNQQQVAEYAHSGLPDLDYVRKVERIVSDSLEGKRLSAQSARTVLAGLDGPAHPANKMVGLAALTDAAHAGQFPASVRDEAIATSIRQLQSPAPGLRAASAALLRELGDKRAVGPILPLLNDPHPQVRKVARQALRRLGYAAQ